MRAGRNCPAEATGDRRIEDFTLEAVADGLRSLLG
jgi:hypothetical protein